MLLIFSQFILKLGVRTPLMLLSPPVTLEEDITLPRFAVLHYLNTETHPHFPTRDLSYFRDVPKNKKIPITHIYDLDTHEGVGVLENKVAKQETRKWQQANTRSFRTTDLVEIPNTDSMTVSVYNYGILTDLYRYKTSPTTNHYKYYNLHKTYFNWIKKGIAKDQESFHFIKIDLPNGIPNYNLIDIILKFNPIKFSRVVSDDKLRQVLDLYRWLSPSTRIDSTLSDITDEDAKRIVVQLTYKGYSSFIPLGLLIGLSDESTLESKIKYKAAKVKKLFILSVRKLQDRVNGIIEGTEVVPDLDTPNVPDINVDVLDEDTDEAQSSSSSNQQTLPSKLGELSTLTKTSKSEKLKALDDLSKLSDTIEVTDLSNLIENSLSEFESESEDVNDLYEETVRKVSSTPEIEVLPTLEVNYDEAHVEKLLQPKTLDTAFEKHLAGAVTFKTMTSTEIRNLRKLKEARVTLKSPYNPDLTLDESKITVPQNSEMSTTDMKMTFDNDLIEPDLKKEVMNTFDQLYLKKLLRKDVLASVATLEKAGIVIKDYQIEENTSSVGKYEVHKLTIKPLTGKESTVFFRLPIVDSESEFVSGNIKYRMRKTKHPVPIVKVSPTRVALTSNYSKLFVFRTDRKTNNLYGYLVDFIKKNYLDSEGTITKVIPGVKSLNTYKLPNVYTSLASEFNEVRTNNVTLLLNYKSIADYITPDVQAALKEKNLLFCGHLANKHIVVCDYDDQFYDYTEKMTSLGTIEDLLEMDPTKVPKPYTVIKVLGDDIPLGVVLSYYLGLSGLLSVTNTKYKLLESRERYTPTKTELVLRFSDHKLVVETDTVDKQLLFNGFLFYKDFTKDYEVNSFDYKEIFLNVLEFRDSGLIHIKELNLLEELFLDPITIDVLRSINEPTEYLKLLLRANNLLTNLSHPDINDPNFSRIRGHDRIPGLMYRALCESVRDFKIKGRTNSKIELDPYKVWNYITQDNTVKITEDVNPINDVKESETLTLTGVDGLNKDATPKMMRRFHPNEVGLTSEGTVDSSDVALNTYLTPYAKIKDLRGLVDSSNHEVIENPGKAFSTSAMLAPMSDTDSAARINFVQIQNSHTIYAEGYRQPILRTGYEYVMPYKVGKLYAIIAEQDGTIFDVTEKILTAKYKDGSMKSYKIGKQYGRMEGSIYPHLLLTSLKTGSKFKANDYLAYNVNFFEPDWLDPTRLIMKFGKNVTVAMTMTDEVFEDSSSISQELSLQMKTSVIKEKIFIMDFNKNIVNLVSEGTVVVPSTILFTMLDDTTDLVNLSESSINMLQNLSSLAPKAKYNGTVERIEIKYNGEISDMSPTLRKLVTKLDKQTYEESKGTEYEATNNRVTAEYRSEGKNLTVDSLELKVFIRVTLEQGVGDKGVFSAQMKSVLSDVFSNKMVTESGVKIDATFSYKSVLNRSVNSPILAGMTNRLLKHVSTQVADVYFGSK
jgi:hypothetical protein